jgi:hypothetical protein
VSGIDLTIGVDTVSHSFTPVSGENVIPITFADFSSVNSITLSGMAAEDASIAIKSFNIPEPGTAGLLGAGLLGLAAAAPRRRAAC